MLRTILKLWFLGALLVSGTGLLAGNVARIRVTGSRVNLRAANSDRVEVVGQVELGRELDRVGEPDGHWIPVAPPEEFDLWIYADLVEQGRVVVNRAQIRSGAGLNYRVVGSVEKDSTVTVRGRMGDWLRIAPPAGTRLWIHADYAQPLIDPLPSVPPTEPPVAREADPDLATMQTEWPPVPRPIDAPEPAEPAEPPALPAPAFPPAREHPPPPETVARQAFPEELRRLTPDVERLQGDRSQFTGVLRRSGLLLRRPASFRLVVHDPAGRATTICYLLGPSDTLRPLVGHRVRIEGAVFWVTGKPEPVVVLDLLWRLE